MKNDFQNMTDNPIYEAIRRYAARLLTDPDAAQDIAQEVFLRLEKHRETVTSERAWAYRAARNLVIDRFRRQDRLPSSGEEPAALPAEATLFDPAKIAEKKEMLEMMHTKINALPPRQREVLRLKFQEGLKYAEIAEVIDESVATVGWLLHEAIGRLRQELQEGDSHPVAVRGN